MNLQERFAELFGSPPERGVQSAITKLCGVSRPTVSAWFTNPEKVSSISRRHAEQICATYFPHVSPTWLAEGFGPKVPMWAPEASLATNVSEAPSLGPTRLIPVVGHVKAGPDGYLEEMQFPVGHGEGYVEYWTRDDEAYALRIKGDSMHPRYRAGEFIVVTPKIEPQPGRDVVVKLKDGRKLLKQLNWIRGDELQLLSINDGYAPTTLSLEEIETIHRVAGGVPPDAFQEPRQHQERKA